MKFTPDGAIDIDDPSVWPTIEQVQAVREWTARIGQPSGPPQSFTDRLSPECMADRRRARSENAAYAAIREQQRAAEAISSAPIVGALAALWRAVK